MTNDHRPSALRSLGVGALIGVGVLAIMALFAGCAPAPQYSPVPANPPPMPRTNPVILAVESQRSTLLAPLTALVAPGDTNPITLTVRTSAPVSIATAAPILKRGTLSLAWNRSPSPSVVGYRLYFGTNASGVGLGTQSATVGNVTNATLTGLDEGTRYFVSAVAYDATGTESAESNEASGVTPIYVGQRSPHTEVYAFGVVGKTNMIQQTTSLVVPVVWQTIFTWVGTRQAVSVMHTNLAQAWFRVEAMP